MKSESFSFDTYAVDTKQSIITFTYSVTFKFGLTKTFTDKIFLKDIPPESWDKIPKTILDATLQSLLIMIGINYWSAFPTRNIHIKNFSLTREQADFWNTLYLHGLGEFFYLAKIDFRDLISFPYDENKVISVPEQFDRPTRALLLNGAGKDSLLSAEMLKASKTPFDFFAFSPTPAHARTAKLAGIKTVSVTRKRDPIVRLLFSGAYPSVSTFTFIAVLLAELLGYDSVIFSNERSADIGNLEYLGLPVNHQWCKSSDAERLINDYIQRYITPTISSYSLLRKFSELEIVRRFVEYPQYLYSVTSCNTYFGEPPPVQRFSRSNYWCKRCPKCVFLFACFSAFLPKKEVVGIFGDDLYTKKRLLPLFKRILGVEGFKPLDCVGEPEEMILAMHYAARTGAYTNEPAISLFNDYFPTTFNFAALENKVFDSK